MKLSDLFVPKYLHSNPEVRIKAVKKSDDIKLLRQMAEKDEDSGVRVAAADQATILEKKQQAVLSGLKLA